MVRTFFSLMQWKIIVSVGLVVTGIFIAGALFSYFPYDCSWYYACNTASEIHNWFGQWGAHCAAWCFYWWGKSAYLLVIGLWTTAYLLYRKDSSIAYVAHWSTLFSIVVASSILTLYYGYEAGRVGYLLFPYIRAMTYGWEIMFAAVIIGTGIELYMFFPLLLVISRMVIAQIIMAPFVYVLTNIYRKLIYAVHDVSSTKTSSTSLPSGDFFAVDTIKNDENVVDESYSESVIVRRKESSKEKEISETLEPFEYQLPSSSLFTASSARKRNVLQGKDKVQAALLEEKLQRFGIHGSVMAIKSGPVVTVFEYEPRIDTKLSKILALEDDLALALQAVSVRIIAPIPGTNVVGFEVAHGHRSTVCIADIITSSSYQELSLTLPIVLGVDTTGIQVIGDLSQMPHLLVAGSTGSGKSVALNTMLAGMLCARSPQEMKLILIDPKRLEFSAYADIAHLLFPVITSSPQAIQALQWVVAEMEQRYQHMAQKGVRNISEYHTLYAKEELPYIVVVIDELADLMITAGRDIELLIMRIAQMARAAGIHMIVATQRPSVDVITGIIKVNFPSRIAFRVTSKIDSRTILDTIGAEKLLGSGDMLFLNGKTGMIQRVHGAYISDTEIKKLVGHIKSQQEVEYLDISETTALNAVQEDNDDLLPTVLEFVRSCDHISISLLQRRFKIGYNRSARLIDMLQARGIITPPEAGKVRKVIR